jgi:uncharacterized protein
LKKLVTGLALALSWSGAVLADGESVFWEVSGKHNTVYLLGSVHLLPNSDRSLPVVTEAAYLDAEKVVQELDIVAASADLAGGAALSLQTLPAGQKLADVLGPELHGRLQKAAAAVFIDVDYLSRMQPWYVALTLMQARLLRSGFNPTDGVDYQIAMRAQADRKPLQGLETAAEQLQIFAKMSMREQRAFLSATIDDTDVSGEITEIVAAWRRGDLQQLESLLRSGAEESPEFFKALTTDRNLKWLPKIETMLADPKDDYLVVTGALHMVGDQGLVELLRRKGYKIVRK